jgi:GAF domain-containing protein
LPELLRGLGCAERFRDQARQHGVQGGLCVPVPGADGAAGSLTLATCRAVGETALNALQPLALLFSRHLHLACLRFIAAEHAAHAPRAAATLRGMAYLG